MSLILGISSYYHDSAAAIIVNNEIVAAVQEERFSRIKHDSSFPFKSIEYVLKAANVNLSDLDNIIFYEKPFLKFERLIETHIAFAPHGFKSFCASIPIWLREKLFQKRLIYKNLKQIDKQINENKIKFSEHHLSHAASAFYPSPFDEALILTLDGVGEWSTTTLGIGKGNKINILEEINFPHSIGLLYSAFTYYLGFKVNSGEYKVMGLAPYGEPKYQKIILDKLINVKEDGSFRLDMSYFNYATGLTMTNKKFSEIFGKQVRKPEDKLEQFHLDIASSIQVVVEEIILKISKYIKNKYKISNLCLAGGVALNCVANGKILKKKIFDNIWIQPAAGDAGGALGAALAFNYLELKKSRISGLDQMKGSLLGPRYTDKEIENDLEKNHANYDKLNEQDLFSIVSNELVQGKAIGWFQGRLEYGPRALGNRSIIADPRSKSIQKDLNIKIKFRESFRPFAPAVLREYLSDFFELNCDSPYMLLVASVKNKISSQNKKEKSSSILDQLNQLRSNIPAVTHVDYSARVQTVHKDINKKFYDLISKFNEISSCPVVVNTSFNIRGEPIVCSPSDAFKCFMGTNLDILVIENYILFKDKQKKISIKNYKDQFELD